jgi:Ca2+-binding EF-hand superfamily protein
MDRNRDGDISRREFLGPRAAFERLDSDRDGLIDSVEAARTTP